jgi:NitT/TauT family transport system substrate-binding protein
MFLKGEIKLITTAGSRRKLSGLLLLAAALAGCRTAREPVTIGIQTSPAMALVMVAKDKQFFQEEGVDAELKEFTAGKFALQAFLGGSLDFAVAGEVPVTLATLQGERFLVLCQVVEKTIKEVRVVARRDGDLSDPSAYFKKTKRKLATSLGGGPEFFTYTFLKKIGIKPDEVQIISQQPEEMPFALANGSVDAISVFDPAAFLAEKQLGDKGISFADASAYSELYVLTVKQQTIDKNPAIAEKIVRALVRAQQFIQNSPDDAKNIVVKYTKLERGTVDGIWGNFVFAPAITPQLLEYQNQEAAWAREKGDVARDAPVPDFRSRLYPEPLRKARPEAVRLP